MARIIELGFLSDGEGDEGPCASLVAFRDLDRRARPVREREPRSAVRDSFPGPRCHRIPKPDAIVFDKHRELVLLHGDRDADLSAARTRRKPVLYGIFDERLKDENGNMNLLGT